ncbi:type II toxin-antitoxin system HicB family antitoxin [Pelotomaculum isophthalicicum JI]|uniref:Type II toxin-antitoxin system HicB family antitoxin n=1 Tax=Pelotomaculum isophthalicicum JI TaxID=947010 RepID=A0A9X4JSU0_9FIRM|nr:type II toxin-antitoxin system HicB family antitoxin [Pelotomaculum isophthalicicum]MDF9407404.1 type II toxin-antitoxin system HicB family antitoxin [Pelotomaculum isophthalicicum JI]
MFPDRYIYPAIFSYKDDSISIEFPDLPGCLLSAETNEEAFRNAKEALGLYLLDMENDGERIPEPTVINNLNLEPNQMAVPVEVWMPAYREDIDNKAVKKTVILPKWLNDMAENEKINLSHLLQSALKNHFGISDYKKQP